MDEHTTHIIDEVAKKKGLFINTTGREPTYLIMNKYTYDLLLNKLVTLAVKETDPTISFDSVVGLPVAILPVTFTDEVYVEVV